MTLDLDQIKTDGGTQPRESINWQTVDEYIEAKRGGAKFPPVTCYYDGKSYWLADGFHRVEAARKIGAQQIVAEVHQGTRREAILHSVGANADHGLRRTNADKRRAVMALLNDDEWSRWSNIEIARQCRIDDKTVAKYRREITPEFRSEDQPTERTYTTKHGTTATMRTENIGRREDSGQQSGVEYAPDQDEPKEYVFDEWIDDDESDEDTGAVEDTPAEQVADNVIRYYDILTEKQPLSTQHEVANILLKHFRNLSSEYNRRTA